MRRMLPWMLVAVLALSLGMVAYTQRSGPTPEDKTLARRLIQAAFGDLAAVADPGERGWKTCRWLWESDRFSPQDGRSPVSAEQVLDLLHGALEDACKLPVPARDEAVKRILVTVSEVDGETATRWIAELVRRGVDPGPGTSESSMLAADLSLKPSEITAAQAELLGLSERDLDAAIARADALTDSTERMGVKVMLAYSLQSRRVSTDVARRLLVEAATLADRLDVTPSTIPSMALLAGSLGLVDGARGQRLMRRVCSEIGASADAAYRARWLWRAAELCWDAAFRVGGRDADTGGPPRRRLPQGLRELVSGANADAYAAALSLPVSSALRQRAVHESYNRELFGDRQPVEGDRTRFARALEWARQLPVEDGQRASATLLVAGAALDEARDLVPEVLAEAHSTLPESSRDWEGVLDRAGCIATAAYCGDKRCWDWAVADAELIRRSFVPEIDDPTSIPLEMRRACAEALILGATLGAGDIQRTKRLLENQARAGGYDVMRAAWCAAEYVWDPRLSRDLAEGILRDMKVSRSPLRACVSALAAAPGMAYRSAIPNQEVTEDNGDLFDEALSIARDSAPTPDGALAAAGLAVAAVTADPVRSATAVQTARQVFLAIPEDADRDGIAQMLCATLAVADPKVAAELAANVKDPARRMDARLAAASGMLVDWKAGVDQWLRSNSTFALDPGRFDTGLPDLDE